MDKDDDVLKLELDIMLAEETKLVTQLDTLRCKIQAHRSRIFYSHNKRSATSKLPAETLSAIFRAGPVEPAEWENYAMAVSWVSREWRAIALSTPSLWNIVRIHRLNLGQGQLKVMKMFIDRSRSRSLHVHIDMCDDFLYPYLHEDEEIDEIRDHLELQTALVFPLVSRWYTLDITSVQPSFLGSLKPLEDMVAPILHSLRVERDPNADKDYDNPLCLFQRTNAAPALTSADITGLSCHIPCSSLTSLRLGPFPEIDMDIFQLVEASKSLVQLHIQVYDNYHVTRVFEMHGPHCIFPVLRRLVVTIFQDIHWGAVECILG